MFCSRPGSSCDIMPPESHCERENGHFLSPSMARFEPQRKNEASLALMEEMIETVVKRVNRRAIVELSGGRFGCTWNSAVLSCFCYHRVLTGLKQQPFCQGRNNQEVPHDWFLLWLHHCTDARVLLLLLQINSIQFLY